MRPGAEPFGDFRSRPRVSSPRRRLYLWRNALWYVECLAFAQQGLCCMCYQQGGNDVSRLLLATCLLHACWTHASGAHGMVELLAPAMCICATIKTSTALLDMQGEGVDAEEEISFVYRKQRFVYNEDAHCFKKLEFPVEVCGCQLRF